MRRLDILSRCNRVMPNWLSRTVLVLASSSSPLLQCLPSAASALGKAAEAYDRMMSGKARFRLLLTMGL